jgi:hypothetical protein
MEQLKTLLMVEYKKRKSAYWWPVWIIAGLTALTVVALIIALIVESPDIVMYDTDASPMGLRIGMYGTMFSFGIIFLAFMGLGAQTSLNREKQLGSDLFFRCQPVSFWKVTGVKYFMHVYASSILLLALGIAFAVIMTVVSAFFINGFYLGNALYGAFLGWLNYLKLAMVFGSLCFLFSAIFKNNALLLGAAALGILEGLFAIIEVIFRNTIQLPDVFVSLGRMVGNMGLDDIDTVNMGMIMGDWRILLGVLFAAACYVTGSLIYKLRAKDA